MPPMAQLLWLNLFFVVIISFMLYLMMNFFMKPFYKMKYPWKKYYSLSKNPKW
uniref:ATP synthase F0 subunit 6 n=1 Tax=Lyreidus brevifrons TaxID=1617980 RepID=A0A0D3QU34_LYRBR|nr:ATP synthase F0 subunit 6 [Lyreidus brevifrons]AJR19292.1 ATP synthase F0 subunit 6 [Lyreidus brevifrons]